MIAKFIRGIKMGKYLINEIIVDGYERFAVVQNNKREEQLCVHFLEYDEFIEHQRGTRKKKVGDVLDGKLSIQLVSSSKKVDEAFSYNQKIAKSSHIEAVVEVVQVIAADSVHVLSSIVPEWILVEFENEVDYKVGDRIRVVGSLEINLE